MEPTGPDAAYAPTPGVYTWQAPGKPLAIQLEHEIVDRLLSDVMLGFGAAPRRGVERGGILLGSVTVDDYPVVRIEDFEPILCQHVTGPSYILSEEEQQQFQAAVEQWQPGPDKRVYAVGFYRSHTRAGLGLSVEDLSLYSRLFPNPYEVALLVKPFATRPSVGAFFFRENGNIRSESSYLEFPFRRRELSGAADSQPDATAAPDGRGAQQLPAPEAASAATAPPSRNRGWVWIPLSFIFLLLGVVLGFQVALSVRSQTPGSRSDPYTLNLSATPSGDSLHVNWDRTAPAIERAQRGALVIQDGPHQKTVSLDAVQLQNGSIIYRRASTDVRFRLEVFAREHVSVSETLHVRLDGSAATPDAAR